MWRTTGGYSTGWRILGCWCLLKIYLRVYLLSTDDTGGYEFVCVKSMWRANVVVGTRVWSLVTDGSPAWHSSPTPSKPSLPPHPLKTIPPPAPQIQPLNGCRVAGKSINIFHLAMRYFHRETEIRRGYRTDRLCTSRVLVWQVSVTGGEHLDYYVQEKN